MIINFEVGEIVTAVGKCEGMRSSIEFKDMEEYEQYRKHLQEDSDRMIKTLSEDLPKVITAITKAMATIPGQQHGGCSCHEHGGADEDPILGLLKMLGGAGPSRPRRPQPESNVNLREKKEEVNLKPKDVELHEVEGEESVEFREVFGEDGKSDTEL